MRKVKFFEKLYDCNSLDKEINGWIEDNNMELIDAKLSADWEDATDYVKYTATVIYTDKSEGRHEI